MGRLRDGRRAAIESDGATPFDSDGLKLSGINSIRQLHVAEARNISIAVTKYLAGIPSKRKAPFTLEWSYKLHREMFGDVWEWAGRRRNTDLNLGFSSPVYEIDPNVSNLLEDLAAWSEHRTYSVLEQAVRLHHRAVRIHPFRNGNGRWSRLLSNIWLRRHQAPLVNWPEGSIVAEGDLRREYLDAVKAADDHNLAPLLKLSERYSS